MKTKIATIIGARPQFIKAATVSRAIAQDYQDDIEEIIIHTGQHFDDNMSVVFFNQLKIPQPKYNLEISGGSHGIMTGRNMAAIEEVLFEAKPDWVLVYGDTNTTLAAALVAAKLHIPLCHVEAGLRSYNKRMPEEINRIVADHVSDLLFCPTAGAVKNLAKEGIMKNVHNVGDVMLDAALYCSEISDTLSNIMGDMNLVSGKYILATCHRAENTDDRGRLMQIVGALNEIGKSVDLVLPLHPRTRKALSEFGLMNQISDIKICDPLPFFDMIVLEKNARRIITDSGGVQKEAYFYKVPCVTMRDETEWIETVELGWNRLVGACKEDIIEAANAEFTPVNTASPFGEGNAAGNIVEKIVQW